MTIRKASPLSPSMGMRAAMIIVETNGRTMKHLVGTCVNSFDADGECIVPALGWLTVSDLAVADEEAREMSPSEFRDRVVVPADVEAAVAGHAVSFLQTAIGVFMLYDEDDDIHYFSV